MVFRLRLVWKEGIVNDAWTLTLCRQAFDYNGVSFDSNHHCYLVIIYTQFIRESIILLDTEESNSFIRLDTRFGHLGKI